MLRPGVLDDVLEGLLRHAEERRLDVAGQLGGLEIDLDLEVAAEGRRQARQGGGEAQVVEDRRPEPDDGIAGFVERVGDERLGRVEIVQRLVARRAGARRRAGGSRR